MTPKQIKAAAKKAAKAYVRHVQNSYVEIAEYTDEVLGKKSKVADCDVWDEVDTRAVKLVKAALKKAVIHAP